MLSQRLAQLFPWISAGACQLLHNWRSCEAEMPRPARKAHSKLATAEVSTLLHADPRTAWQAACCIACPDRSSQQALFQGSRQDHEQDVQQQ